MAYDFARYLNIRSAISPVLSPDGSRVAFLSDVTGNFQVWSVGTRGEGDARWPRQLTFLPDKVWELHGTPAAPHLIAVSDVGGNERYQLYLVENYGVDSAGREAHEVRRLTTNDDAMHTFGAFSRDGRRILYTSNARNGIHFDLYSMEIESGRSTLLHESDGLRSISAWSPDGRYVLSVDEVGSLENELYLLDLKSGQERRISSGRADTLHHGFNWALSGLYLISDALHDRGSIVRLDTMSGIITPLLSAAELGPQGEIEHLAVAPDGRHAACTLNAGGYSRLFLLDLQSGTHQQVEGLANGVIGTLRWNARGTFLVMDLQTPMAPPDIWSVRVIDATCRQLTFSNRAGINAATFAAPTSVSFPSFDRLEIPAFYYRPNTPAPQGGFPCILYVHGGPASQVRPNFFVSFQYFLQQGYAVLAPNVRGSSGYGRRYTALDEVELRMESVADLKAAVEWLHGRAEINSGRIAVYGRSYGGFMVLAALTEYPELFAAGINVVGIANWVTFLERTGPWRRAHREREYGSLTANRDFLERISPIHKIEKVRAPLLVLAGNNDPRVPLSESEQVVQRIAAAGGQVEFIHYADEGHIFSKLPNRIDSFTQIAAFLERHL